MTQFRKSSYWYRKSKIKDKNISKGGRLNFSYHAYGTTKSTTHNHIEYSSIRFIEASYK